MKIICRIKFIIFTCLFSFIAPFALQAVNPIVNFKNGLKKTVKKVKNVKIKKSFKKQPSAKLSFDKKISPKSQIQDNKKRLAIVNEKKYKNSQLQKSRVLNRQASSHRLQSSLLLPSKNSQKRSGVPVSRKTTAQASKPLLYASNKGKSIRRVAPLNNNQKRIIKSIKKVEPTNNKISYPKRLIQGNGRFQWPIKKGQFWVSCYYGTRARGRLHAGLDLAACSGTPVYASAAGRIDFASNAGSYGNMILIKHNNRYKSRYAHLSKILVHKKMVVQKGQLIGLVGNTGNVTGKNGEHLHFEILINNRPKNPIRLLS